jgi:hypothetical protein
MEGQGRGVAQGVADQQQQQNNFIESDPKEASVKTLDELAAYLSQPAFIIYLLLVKNNWGGFISFF